MKPHIGMVTLTVGDLPRALHFYREGMGLASEGIIGTEFEIGAVAFFDLGSGLKLALWPRDYLSKDTGISPGPVDPAPQISIGHNVASREEVGIVLEQARKAGATIVKEAHVTFWGGYSGYFRDPDGHLWEVLFNPGFLPD